MKKKDFKEMKTKKTEELIKAITDRKVELAKMAIKIKSGEEKNLKKAKNIRLEIARISSLVREKELAEKETEK